MSSASNRVEVRVPPRAERLDPWIAACVSALLHLLMLLLLLLASKPSLTAPQGATSGGRVKVDFVGQTRQPVRPVKAPPSPPPPQKPEPARTRPAASRVQSTLVEHAKDPAPPQADDAPDTTAQRRPPRQRPTPPPVEPPPTLDEATQSQAQTPAASPPPTQRHPETWTGRPPGMLEEDTADGSARGTSIDRGRRNDPQAAQASLEVGGYQVWYGLRSATQLRAWMDQGMKELSIPLPGTQYYMVCPAQVALDRGSGKCRLVAPDSPELKAIGDAREVIDMIQVYRRGELVWSGPGPYR
ncbi:type II toxin-antitoxin system RelE/ParE family toxin [Xanthomonas theicola]|uniref:Plasmid stabilization protein ParE n=1 Tax=Xanthomonas theicola TaxID=56464 RepID=A0A2S6ZG04_9XANT|nr:type II toxin-antitoxin system RelE/ParE family toxin [Xanthomonas theicola]PPT91194.1 plasmid stabilization protein ParE [Xanthomonas theicola]QNH25900.1 type II toxin-antitoxin system RelE/ParE family toxin [Xanthomonas theicola]